MQPTKPKILIIRLFRVCESLSVQKQLEFKVALNYCPHKSCGNAQKGLFSLNHRKHESVNFYKPVHFSLLYTA